MCAEIKDVAVVIDGEDPVADVVQAGVALRLSDYYGARIKVFEQGKADRLEQLTWIDGLELPPYAGIEICGIQDQRLRERYGLRSPLSELLHAARLDGGWVKRADANDLLQSLRSADLIVAGLPLTSKPSRKPEAEDIVMTAGRPVLVVPRKFAQRHVRGRTIGHRVLIAWNASAPSARAIHDALPFLRRAEEITLLCVSPDRDQTQARHSVDAMADHLARHDVKAQPDVMTAGGLGPSRVILDRIDELNINLLVMGAFGRSRLAESWFGGVSAELLHAVDIPVLTSH